MNDKIVEYTVLISEQTDLLIDFDDIDKSGKVFKFKTPLNHISRKTQNDNLFTRDMIETGIKQKKFQRRLGRRKLYGEFHHPLRKNPERYVNVWENMRSHLFTDFWFDGELFMASVETAIGAYGDDMIDMIRQRSQPCFSLRGVGKTRKYPNGKRQTHLDPITWDNVHDASEEAAWSDKDSYKIIDPTDPTDQGVDVANKLFMECDIKSISGVFKDVKNDIKLIAESYGGFNPEKAVYTPDGGFVGYYSESKTAVRKVEGILKHDINEFMKL